MKKILRYLSVLVVAAAFQSCSTTYLASAPYDEVYDTRPAFSQTAGQPSQGQQSATPSASDNYPDRSQAEPDYRDYSAVQQQYSSGNQQTYSQEVVSEPDRQVTYYDDNTNFDYDDYYDYSYSVRIKRFHRPVYGFGYYDDYYTNLYWYTYDPWVWGTSVYLGYDWWWWDCYGGPYFSLGFNWGWGSIGWHWGHPFSGWYYYPHFYYRYPWSPWYWGYGGWGYWAGYNHGYWDGYWFGRYYNSFDQNSYYYGPRISRNETSGARSGGGTFGEFYESRVNQRRIGGDNNTLPDVRTGTAGSPQESLTQRRINASGGNNAVNPATPSVAGEVNQKRIGAGNAATQAAATQAASEGNSNPRISAGNTNNAAVNVPASEGNVANPRVNAANANISAPQTSEQNEGQRQNPQGRVTNIGGEQVRVGYDSRRQESSVSGYNSQDELRRQQAQERYATPRSNETPAQRYDYNKYRRQNPAANREELAKPRTETQAEEGKVRNYTPPTYTQPKRSDVYTSPRNYGTPDRTPETRQDRQERYTPNEYQQPNRQYNTPTTPQRQYNAPSTPRQQYNAPANQENRRSYSPPVQSEPRRESSRSSESSSSPSRSYSAPSYSPSYSAPSRSSGGFNSSGSGSPSGRRR